MISVIFLPARPTTAPMCSSATPMVIDSWASILAGDLIGVLGCRILAANHQNSNQSRNADMPKIWK